MCGILYYQGYQDISENDFNEAINKLNLRGPDNNNTMQISENKKMGFTRLSINDISSNGNQPLIKNDNYYLICNGEIYNHKELQQKNEFQTKSNSDCEIIIHMYEKYGIEKTIKSLDGVFAFVLYDKSKNKIFIGRDPYGVRPLFLGKTPNNELLICSEVKPISNLCSQIKRFPIGSFGELEGNLYDITFQRYHNYYFTFNNDSEEIIKEKIRQLFTQAVDKRLMSDRPIGCLLSGGLDSSLVSALVSRNYEPYTLNTFSIGMKGSTDLYYANLAAKHIKSKHHNIELTNDDFLNAIEETIYMIESYDITTVRASVGNYLVGKYIKENTDCKVIYNGDGSEEIMGSYLWLSNIDNEEDFYTENLKLLTEISYYDVLRSDRSISDNGLEPRVPFLDKKFVDYVMSIPPKYKMFGNGVIEKKILREAFANTNLLPNEVLFRKKEAFSDGVSSQEKSWFQIIQEHLETQISDEEFNLKQKIYTHNPPHTKEALYYRELFEKNFKNHSKIIPHFWMPNPKWCNVTDPSARILDNYEK
tara:strand:- start:2851 stop:4449 length:1599 start_codon:yes stop_codon:yes gene_type:complete